LLELSTQLAIASDLGFVDEETCTSVEHDAYQLLGLLNRLPRVNAQPKTMAI
jgi:hypothetical protein